MTAGWRRRNKTPWRCIKCESCSGANEWTRSWTSAGFYWLPVGPVAGLGLDPAHVCLHQPHGPARGSGALAREAAGEAAAQTPADHLPDQPGPPGCEDGARNTLFVCCFCYFVPFRQFVCRNAATFSNCSSLDDVHFINPAQRSCSQVKVKCYAASLVAISVCITVFATE